MAAQGAFREELLAAVRAESQRPPGVTVNVPIDKLEASPPIVNVPAPVVNVAAPIVHLTAAEQAPPVVNVNVPEQPAPVIKVKIPEQAAPVVHVNVPEQPAPVVNVNLPPPEPRTVVVTERDDSGNLKRAEVR